MDPAEPVKPPPDNDSNESLEGSSTVVEANSAPDEAGQATEPAEAPEPTGNSSQPPSTGTSNISSNEPLHHHLRQILARIFRRINIYLLAFALILITGGVILVITFTKSQKPNKQTPSAQNLSQSQLEQIAGTTESVGNANQVLNIGSNTIISGQLLVRKDLDVAGSLKVGGTLNLPGISVSGSSIFQQIQTSKLTVSGDGTIAGNLAVGQGLNVAGTATFGGGVSINQLTVQTLQLNSDLTLSHHIDAGGATPSRSTGSAVGSGGTTSISGSDTSGSISINTGGGAGAGCFITVNFTAKFNATPHVVITPIGSAAAGLAYYVNRSTTGFSICTTSTPPSGSSFGFDYIVFD